MENNTIPQTPEDLMIAQARIALVWMYGTPAERDEGLRVFVRLIGEYRKVVESRDEALAHSRALVHEMDEMSREIDGLRDENAQLLTERDEARREVCERVSSSAPYGSTTPYAVAQGRGWDCLPPLVVNWKDFWSGESIY